ncbi:MAG: D-alanyl-D-alanine carboxypeptidase [Deltaproteobacteria bacterium]|nr:D-alanyl-D-alanine carboxypeptidase [Deltaproteobacteria bacterium]
MFNKRILIIFIFFFTVCLTGLAISPCIHAESLNTGIVLADNHGNILYGKNIDKPFIPASILKILTSLAAIRIFGENYHFPTEYFWDKTSKNLYIKGFGDPLLISEIIEQLCYKINLKTRQIHNIILDQTYFSNRISVPGKGNSLNPYDAPVGALCANFNTIIFKWSQTEDKFVSAEPQTPLFAVFLEDIKKSNLKQGRIILTKQQSRLFPGLLIRHFLKKNNTMVTGSVLQGVFDIKEGKRCSFLSPFEIKEVVQKLLKYSNNFIANQLLLTIGARTYGAPATLEKGVRALKLFSRQYIKLDHLNIFEGSGLSRENLISPDQMLKILLAFMPYHSLLKRQDNDYYKTGTLSGVRTRAGYISGKDNSLYPYVIMVNRKNKGYESIRKDLLDMVSQMSGKMN